VALTLYLGVALALDARNLDRTRGGYEPPYTGFTGEPLRFEEVAVAAEGGVVRGRVLDSLIHCETGVWRFEVLGFGFDYRGVSERALVVHKPQEICRRHGFDTSAWDQGY
jgi:hypothetical protein